MRTYTPFSKSDATESGRGDKQESFIGLFIRLSAHGPPHSESFRLPGCVRQVHRLGELPLEYTQPPRRLTTERRPRVMRTSFTRKKGGTGKIASCVPRDPSAADAELCDSAFSAPQRLSHHLVLESCFLTSKRINLVLNQLTHPLPFFTPSFQHGHSSSTHILTNSKRK